MRPMNPESRIVKLRSGQYAVQVPIGVNWYTTQRFDTEQEAKEYQDEKFADEVMEIIR